jgi:hypothetical protein
MNDPFESPRADKIVTRAISRAWPMTISLTDLGREFTVEKLAPVEEGIARAAGGRFMVTPGVYILSANGPTGRAPLPAKVGQLGLAEYHGPRPDTVPLTVMSLARPEYAAGREAEIRVRIVNETAPDSATLFLRRIAGDWYRAFPLRSASPFEYSATVPAAAMREGPSEFVVTVFQAGKATTFPERVERLPWSWDYSGTASWKVDVTSPSTPLLLFSPARDAARLNFTRIGDAGRRGLFRIGYSPTGRPAFHFELPVDSAGEGPPDYTASLVVQDRITSRTFPGTATVHVRARALGPGQVAHITLMEDDGTSWTHALRLDTAWVDRAVPVTEFKAGRGVLLPQGFPGQWSYWVTPAEGRGGADDRLRLDRIERLQISVRREEGTRVAPGSYGVEIESVALSGAR